MVRSSVSLLKRVFRRIPRVSTNYWFHRTSANPYSLVPNDSVIVDIGSKGARGKYSFGIPPQDATLICVDACPGPGVDLVADARELGAIASESVDCVTCNQVLNYIPDPERAVEEIERILKPGGIVYFGVPFVYTAVTEDGDFKDYYRWSVSGIGVLCSAFERLESGYNRGPASIMCHMLVHFVAIALSFNSNRLYGLLVVVASWFLWPMKYLDAVIARYQCAGVICGAVFFLGRKPLPPISSRQANDERSVSLVS